MCTFWRDRTTRIVSASGVLSSVKHGLGRRRFVWSLQFAHVALALRSNGYKTLVHNGCKVVSILLFRSFKCTYFEDPIYRRVYASPLDVAVGCSCQYSRTCIEHAKRFLIMGVYK
jgi:hypothetical protein